MYLTAWEVEILLARVPEGGQGIDKRTDNGTCAGDN